MSYRGKQNAMFNSVRLFFTKILDPFASRGKSHN